MTDSATLHASTIGLGNGHRLAFVETIDNVPIAVLETFLDGLAMMSRAVDAEAAGRGNPDYDVEVEAKAQLVLQGRLEGIQLVWHLFSGLDDGSDDQLRRAALDYRAEYEAAQA